MARINKVFSAVVFCVSSGFTAFFDTTTLAAENPSMVLPEEYLSAGEQTTSLANGGSLSSGGYSAVRANPAMLATEKQYAVGGGYHWPAYGRDFYQAGVVDSKTSSIAAGVSYSSSMDDYQGTWDKEGKVSAGESPVKRRIGVGLAKNYQKISLGISGSFIEATDPVKAFDEDADRVKGFTLGGGLVANLKQNLRIGLSAENLANKKMAFAAPTIYRAGLVWGAIKDFSVYVDLRQREAAPTFDVKAPSLSLFETSETKEGRIGAEQALTVGGIVRFYDLLRLSFGTGAAKQGSETSSTAAAGIALVNKAFVLAYSAQRPDMKLALVHHAVTVGLDVSL